MQPKEKKSKQPKSNNLKKSYTMMLIGIVLCILLDQIVKSVVVYNFESLPIELLGGVLRISFVQNTGAALGIGGSNLLISVLTNLLVLVVIIRFVVKQKDMIDTKTKVALVMMIAGGFSNLIDRVFRNGVIDYIDLSAFMKFPLFNIADILIVLGWILFALFAAINTVKVSREIKEEIEVKKEELERIEEKRDSKKTGNNSPRNDSSKDKLDDTKKQKKTKKKK